MSAAILIYMLFLVVMSAFGAFFARRQLKRFRRKRALDELFEMDGKLY